MFAGGRALFADRHEAGERLARALPPISADALVLGIPRGGVVVARAIADATGASMDVIVVRKLGAPGNQELALGAVGPDGRVVLDEVAAAAVGDVPREYVESERARQAEEVRRRLDSYRAGRGALEVSGRVCVVADDGIATGSTARAACLWLREREASRVIVAAPVAPGPVVERLRRIADEVIVLEVPETFAAVGQFYERFEQVTDDEVALLLGPPTV